MAAKALVGRLTIPDTVFLVCDVQERFRTLIDKMENVIYVAKKLVDAAKILEIPVLVTEQYPSRLGKTVPEVDVSAATVYEKLLFSMVTPELEEKLTSLGRKSVVLFGIEAHVCVLQTTLDLVDRGYTVHACLDGISSQRPFDRFVAIERIKQSGALLTTSESLLFQLIGGAAHPKFKEISALSRIPVPLRDQLLS